ncbi:GNAT family N-acetyltransferase [Nocardioides litoris]|uniref:GNAT family N-acetyltransferase n=1 Tax=Nocardioides litoris TaxID=1926648 RepID=UPI001FEBE331|nr:GNAT family N-acetyltransferase [Nocardioides litoris]
MGRLSRPTLVTERLRLEPLTTDHTELLVELDSDPAVQRFLRGRALAREEVLAQVPRRLRPEADAHRLGYWAGWADGAFLGWWCLIPDGPGDAPDDGRPVSAELGYRLRRDAWGHGYATEGARALLDHAFRTVGLDRVWAETMAVNTGSRGVMTKAGLRHVLTEVRQWDDPLPGWEEGEVRYEVDRASYLGG